MRPNSKRSVLVGDFNITYEINNLGLRGKDISDEKTRYRILFLGDSFAFGVGVPIGERFSDLIGSAFPNIETINAGVPGYGIHQMASWYEHYGNEIEADLVLVPVVECNIDRAIKAHMGEKEKNILTQNRLCEDSGQTGLADNLFKGCIHILGDLKHRLDPYLQMSYFYSYFNVKFRILRMTGILEKRDEEAWRRASEKHCLIEDVDFKHKYREIVVRRIFHSLQEITSLRGAKLAIINIDVYQKTWLSDLLTDLHIPYIDISPYLISSTNIRFELDPHYNSYGNELIGKALAEKLEDMIPKRAKPVPIENRFLKEGLR